MKAVYTPADLESRVILDGDSRLPARYAVLGMPVAHSASPYMHQNALDALGIGSRYIRLEVKPAELASTIQRLSKLGFIGANITVPHKIAAMESCTRLDPKAELLGTVNTLHFLDDKIIGYNTDAPGFRLAVEEALGKSLAGASVLIVGAGGGAGQAIAMSSAMAGVERLILVNRTTEKLPALKARIMHISPAPSEVILSGTDSPGLAGLARSCDVIVQTTSVGLKPDDPSVLGADCLSAGQLVYDTIYQPPVTPLLALAMQCGCRTANGATMLLQQGALAFQIWHPGSNPLEWMRRGLNLNPGQAVG